MPPASASSIVSTIFAKRRAAGVRNRRCLARSQASLIGLTFDRDARLHHVIQHVRLLGEREGEEVVQDRDVRPRHHGADAVADLDDAKHGQGAQRLAHERPAYAELAREFAFGDQAVAGLERAGEQRSRRKANTFSNPFHPRRPA